MRKGQEITIEQMGNPLGEIIILRKQDNIPELYLISQKDDPEMSNRIILSKGQLMKIHSLIK